VVGSCFWCPLLFVFGGVGGFTHRFTINRVMFSIYNSLSGVCPDCCVVSFL